MQSRGNDLERNKRMFGCLLGTLQKFRKEEKMLSSKEEKRTKIEAKLEEQQQLEKAKLKEERDALIANRKRKQLEVKILETKMSKLKDLQVIEESHKYYSNFIKTATKPAIFWLPKVMTPKTTLLQSKSSKEIKELIEERRKQVDEEIKEIEDQMESESADEHCTNDEKKSIVHSIAIADNENGRQKPESNDKGRH